MKVGASTLGGSQAILPGPDLRPVEHPIAQPADSLELGSLGAGLPPASDRVAQLEASVRAFQLEIDEKIKAHETANVIVSCLTPFLSAKGPIDDQVWMALLRIMGKVQGERRDDDIESAKLERLQKAIKAEQQQLTDSQKASLEGALSALSKTQNTLEGNRKGRLEEENRATEVLSSVMRSQHEGVMATLREMRGA